MSNVVVDPMASCTRGGTDRRAVSRRTAPFALRTDHTENWPPSCHLPRKTHHSSIESRTNQGLHLNLCRLITVTCMPCGGKTWQLQLEPQSPAHPRSWRGLGKKWSWMNKLGTHNLSRIPDSSWSMQNYIPTNSRPEERDALIAVLSQKRRIVYQL